MIEKNLSPSYAHLRSLKDLINLEFQKNEDFQLNKEAQVGDHTEAFVSPFACPITNRPLNGKYQFCVLSKCGHVFSKKGIETSQTRDVKVCYVCQKGYVDEDVITFNPNPEEKKILEDRLKQIKKTEKELRKEKLKSKELHGEPKEDEQKTKKKKSGN